MTIQAARESRTQSQTPKRVPFKLECALALLLKASEEGRYVTTLDALSAFGDTCWHSTVASLREKGIDFCQEPYEHQHQHGGTANFQSYRLAPGSVEKAEQVLAFYQSMPRGRRQQRQGDGEQGHLPTAC